MTAQPSLRRSLRTVHKSARRAIAASGGLAPALGTVLGIWRKEGLPGLRRGLALLAAQAELLPTPEADGHDHDDYRAWVRRYDTIDQAARRHLTDSVAALAAPPLISVLLLENSGGEPADKTLGSLRVQIYPHWELCQTPAQARGEAVALLRAGDLLPEHALFCLAKALLDQPQAQVFYADEDSIDASGQRSNPQLKPDCNPELMLATNLCTGLLACRAPLLQQLGGLRAELGGQAGYDLALRAIEAAGQEGVAHLPRVLCHRRMVEETEADAEQGRRVVREHLSRTGHNAEVVPAPGLPLARRVIFPRPEKDRLVSILIPTRDRADLLGACIHSLLDKTAHQGFEILILDNGSVEEATFRLFDSLPRDRVRILPDGAPFNFSRLNNLGARQAKGEFLCLLNNDIEVLDADWLGEMLSFAVRPGVGCVGARLWYPDDTLQHGGILVGLGGSAGHAHRCLPRGRAGYFGRAVLHQSLSAVTAACLVVRKSVFEQVGGLDENLPESYNDVDFCLRVQDAGYRNVWTPYAELRHHESASRRNRPSGYAAQMKEYDRQASLIMRARRCSLREDPAYNPNLTRLGEDFGLAWPPRVAPLDLL